MNHPKFHEPFSPAIMETEVPKQFVDIVNKIADEVLYTGLLEMQELDAQG